MKETVGFLGTGIMGTPMVRNLLAAGYPVVAYNRTRSKAEALQPDGATVATSPAQVAREAHLVLACLGDAEAVKSVVTGPRGLLESVSAGDVFVDMTTNSPPVSIGLASRLAAKGAHMLDAPVSGGDIGAIEGTLSIMVGGEPEVYQRCLPVLEVLGGRITHMGDRVGAGGYAKLANQVMVAINLASMGEALVFGAKAGLDMEKLCGALAGGLANSEAFHVKREKVLSGRFAPGGKATVQLKDLGYIGDCMDEMGISLPVTDLVTGLYRQLVGAGFGDEDHSAIVRVFEQIAGVEARVH